MLRRLLAGRQGALVGSLSGNDGGLDQDLTSGLDDAGGGSDVPDQAIQWGTGNEVLWGPGDYVLWE